MTFQSFEEIVRFAIEKRKRSKAQGARDRALSGFSLSHLPCAMCYRQTLHTGALGYST